MRERERRHPLLADSNSGSSRSSLLRCIAMSALSSSGKSFRSCGGNETMRMRKTDLYDTETYFDFSLLFGHPLNVGRLKVTDKIKPFTFPHCHNQLRHAWLANSIWPTANISTCGRDPLNFMCKKRMGHYLKVCMLVHYHVIKCVWIIQE